MEFSSFLFILLFSEILVFECDIFLDYDQHIRAVSTVLHQILRCVIHASSFNSHVYQCKLILGYLFLACFRIPLYFISCNTRIYGISKHLPVFETSHKINTKKIGMIAGMHYNQLAIFAQIKERPIFRFFKS